MEVSESGISNAYFDKVSNYSLSRLREEPRKINEELGKLKIETEEMSVQNYTAHIDNHRCLTAGIKGLKSMDKDLNGFSENISGVKEEGTKFLNNAAHLVDRHKEFQSTMQQYNQILQLLEIPQLLDACIKRQAFEDALRLAGFVEKLTKRHGVLYASANSGNENEGRNKVKKKKNGFDLILNICKDVKEMIESLRSDLIHTLGGSLTLPLCVRTVGYLRRVIALLHKFNNISPLDNNNNINNNNKKKQQRSKYSFESVQLEKIFLTSRSNYLSAELAKIKQGQPSEYIVKSIEKRRVILCEIMSQYNAIFVDDNNSNNNKSIIRSNRDGEEESKKNDSSTISNEQRLMDWIVQQVNKTLAMLRKFVVMIDDGVALSNVIEQATYMAKSLGKFGADFRSLLVPIFHKRVMKLASDFWEDAILQFQKNIKNVEWLKIDLKSILKSEKQKFLEKHENDNNNEGKDKDSKNVRAPPPILLQFPSLGHFTNAIIGSFNELRHIAFLSLRDNLASLFINKISELIAIVKELDPVKDTRTKKKILKRYQLYCNYGLNACVAHLLILFQSIYGETDARFNKWYKLKAKEINNKMKFNDGNPPSSNMNANNKSNDKKVQSTGVNDGEKINNVNDAAVVSNIDGKDREDEDGDLI